MLSGDNQKGDLMHGVLKRHRGRKYACDGNPYWGSFFRRGVPGYMVIEWFEVDLTRRCSS